MPLLYMDRGWDGKGREFDVEYAEWSWNLECLLIICLHLQALNLSSTWAVAPDSECISLVARAHAHGPVTQGKKNQRHQHETCLSNSYQ